MSVAERIREIRTSKDLSQYKLASLTKQKLNQSQISKIEKGIRRVTDEDMQIIADAFKIPVTKLISDDVMGGS